MVTLWLIAAVAAQVAAYRAVEGGPTGRDRLTMAFGVLVAGLATAVALAGGFAGWWRTRPAASPRGRLLVVATTVAAQTAWYVAEIVDRAGRRTDDPVWVALPLVHIALAAVAGVAVLAGTRLVLALAAAVDGHHGGSR